MGRAGRKKTALAVEIGDRIRRLRISRNMSARTFGTAIGTSAATVCYWEDGASAPTSGHVVAICKRFGVSADRILGLPAGNGDICLPKEADRNG